MALLNHSCRRFFGCTTAVQNRGWEQFQCGQRAGSYCFSEEGGCMTRCSSFSPIVPNSLHHFVYKWSNGRLQPYILSSSLTFDRKKTWHFAAFVFHFARSKLARRNVQRWWPNWSSSAGVPSQLLNLRRFTGGWAVEVRCCNLGFQVVDPIGVHHIFPGSLTEVPTPWN